MRLASLLLLACGCASVPMARPAVDERMKAYQPSATTSLLYVYRPSSMAGTAVPLRVTLDESAVAVLTDGTFTVLTVRPGEHKLVASAAASGSETVVAVAGRSHFFRAGLAMRWSGPSPAAELAPERDEAAARQAVAACRLVADPAAEALRAAAIEIAKVNVRALAEGPLLGAAQGALGRAAGAAAATPDLDAAALALRTATPGIEDLKVFAIGLKGMLEAVRPPPEGPRPTPTGAAIDRSCGLALQAADGELLVVGVVAGSPAAQAGLLAGLQLREVNGFPARGVSPAKAAQALSGPPGSEVALLVGKPGEAGRTVTLRRAADDASAVDCGLVGQDVLYLRPHGLVPATARRVRDLARGANWPPPAVVLDLRALAGGQVDGAAELADAFLESGVILTVSGGRDPAINRTLNAAGGSSALERSRVAVLVDGATSGPAEALAAALQDGRRATVRGQRTAGDDELSTIHRMPGQLVRVPAATLGRPSGQPLRLGVTPDVADEGAAPGPAPALGGAACPGEAAPGPLLLDPMVQRAAAGLRQGG